MIQPDCAAAQLLNRAADVRNANDGFLQAAKLLYFVEAFGLKCLVADRQHLIDQENVRRAFTATENASRMIMPAE